MNCREIIVELTRLMEAEFGGRSVWMTTGYWLFSDGSSYDVSCDGSGGGAGVHFGFLSALDNTYLSRKLGLSREQREILYDFFTSDDDQETNLDAFRAIERVYKTGNIRVSHAGSFGKVHVISVDVYNLSMDETLYRVQKFLSSKLGKSVIEVPVILIEDMSKYLSNPYTNNLFATTTGGEFMQVDHWYELK